MLVIRYQRTGRSGHAQYRLVVQDARRSPTSGKVVAQLGSYNPHTKVAVLNSQRIGHFLNHGAQPSERAALLLKKEGIKLPKWVVMPKKRKSAIKTTEKLRKNRPVEPKAPKAEAVEEAIESVEPETPESIEPAESEIASPTLSKTTGTNQENKEPQEPAAEAVEPETKTSEPATEKK